MILPICPVKKQAKNPQKNDRSKPVKNPTLVGFLADPHTLFGQKGLTLFGQKKNEKNPDSPVNSKNPQKLHPSLEFQKESNERW